LGLGSLGSLDLSSYFISIIIGIFEGNLINASLAHKTRLLISYLTLNGV